MSFLSPIIYGSMGFGNASESEQVEIIRTGHTLGVTSIDTAPLYGQGMSESLVGRAVSGQRSKYQILTKCGLRWDSDHGEVLFTSYENGNAVIFRKNSRPESILTEVEASLKRLNSDYIDLIQIHHFDSLVPLELVLQALETARSKGLIREFGICNYSLSSLTEMWEASNEKLYSIQSALNPIEQHDSKNVLNFAIKHNLPFLAYSPFAQGLLTGKMLENPLPPDDWRSDTIYFSREYYEKVNTILKDTILPLSIDKGCTLAQLFLAWELNQNGYIHPVSGASSVSQAIQNAKSIEIKLSSQEVELISVSFGSLDVAFYENKPSIRSILGKIKRKFSNFTLR